jgi:hypothetical protein
MAYERTDVTLPERTASLPLDGVLSATDAEIATDLLARWSSLDPTARRRLAIAMIARSRNAASAANRQPETTASESDQALRAQLEHLAQGRSG